MQLVLALSLIWALFHTGQPLQCLQCANTDCTNTTSVVCAAGLTVCKTETIVETGSGPIVNKTCAAAGDCLTPMSLDVAYIRQAAMVFGAGLLIPRGTEMEHSVNLGVVRRAVSQICCYSDNCNLQTLAVSAASANGKVCPACNITSLNQTSSCNTTLSCLGNENRCFNLTRTNQLLRGCMSKNLCLAPIALALQGLGQNTVACGAPSSISLALGLLTFRLVMTSILTVVFY